MHGYISKFLGLMVDQLWNIIFSKYETHKEGIEHYQEFINKCKVENFEELDEETYEIIKQAIKEYNKTGDIKKEFLKFYSIEVWNSMKLKY